MNTRMIEVALGLALVFAMASLLLTAVRELWASVWSSRGKVLAQALTSFVGDDPDFASKLMQHPLLVSLSKDPAGLTAHPSYMGADIVIASLVAALVERLPNQTRPASPIDFLNAIGQLKVPPVVTKGTRKEIKASRDAAPLHPNPALVRGMASLVHGVESDWAAYEARLCAWYDSVTQRSTGWFKRKNQLSLLVLGYMVAAAININPILIASRLWEDAPLREAIAAAARNAANSMETETETETETELAAGVNARDCASLEDPQVTTLCLRLNEINQLKNTGLPMGWNPLVIPKVTGSAFLNWVLLFVGWAITAIAVSLGAPFWFDALGKLSSLRSAGPRPSAADRSGIASTPPGGTTLSQPISNATAPPPPAAP